MKKKKSILTTLNQIQLKKINKEINLIGFKLEKEFFTGELELKEVDYCTCEKDKLEMDEFFN